MASKLPECPVCLEEYSRTQMPMLLPCGHALCKLCFDISTKRNTVECPQDRKKSNVKNLSPAYDLMSTIEQLQELKLQINQESSVKEETQTQCNSKIDVLEKQFREKLTEYERTYQERAEKMIEEVKREEEEKRIRYVEQMNEISKVNTEKHLKKLSQKIRQGKIRINGSENPNINRERQNPRDDNRIYWSWQSSDHKWNEYDHSISSKIESAYRSGVSYAVVKANNRSIKIDFDQWRETSGSKIKRINTITSAPLWKFLKSPKKWVALLDSECFKLDVAWINNENHVSINIDDEKNAVCNFDEMSLRIQDKKFPLVREILS
ncbi:unnamed protein product [Blepharisma stoltei]|uniref:RING-type domain-containing protein n=1 Tax=Blepharisma stoltei TaxID=1481888 RepID=A0AAU9IPW0_9CILI|nr:unnamed protein product [Blepharisma stoltei]